jgi:hypothetical protein
MGESLKFGENYSKLSILQLDVDITKNLKRSLANTVFHSREAAPVEESENQGQLVVTKKCKTCMNNCKIKVNEKLFEHSLVNCPDYKPKPIKFSI